jgi:large subunit ribosomal protein L17
MRHRKASRRLSRTTPHRKAMMRNLVTSLFLHDKVETTWAKAKEVKPVAEKMITLARAAICMPAGRPRASSAATRCAASSLTTARERYQERSGGYIRVVPTRVRRGDAAPMAIVEIIGAPEA